MRGKTGTTEEKDRNTPKVVNDNKTNGISIKI